MYVTWCKDKNHKKLKNKTLFKTEFLKLNYIISKGINMYNTPKTGYHLMVNIK